MRLTWIMVLLLLWSTAALASDPRRIGPFRLGMTEAQVRSAGQSAGLARPRMEVPQAIDIMGLGVMTVRPVVLEGLSGSSNSIARARLILVSGRAAYIALEYDSEDTKRRDGWFERYNAPETIRDDVMDLTWARGGVVLHTDRYGTALHAVDWAGLKASDRALVSEVGAIRVANRYFRQTVAQRAEISLDFLRAQVADWYASQTPGQYLDGCKTPESTSYTPGYSACETPEKRFSATDLAWKKGPWTTLIKDPRRLAPEFAYRIESSGSGRTSRIMLTATGDIDCDGKVSTLRVYLRQARTQTKTCQLDSGTWEAIDPLE